MVDEREEQERKAFEEWVLSSLKKTQPWCQVERSGDGYLDLYVQKHWEGWLARARFDIENEEVVFKPLPPTPVPVPERKFRGHGMCEYCGSLIKYCPIGDYCTNDECGYVDGCYIERPSFKRHKSGQSQQ